MNVSAIKNTLLKQQIYSKIPTVGAVQNISSKNLLSLFLFASSNASFEKCNFYLILSFVLSRKIININNNIARKYGNVTVKNFRKYEKLEQKGINKNLTSTFSIIANNLTCIRNYLSLNCQMFLIKTICYYFISL